MTEQAIFKACLSAAAAAFKEHDDVSVGVPFALGKARAAAQRLCEGIVLRAVDDAKREAPAKHDPNPLYECPLCSGPAVSFL